MDEKKEICPICNHPWTRHIIIGVMVFLGAFAAFYVVSDMYFKTIFSPEHQMKRMERQFMRNQHQMDRRINRDFEKGEHLYKQENEVIHMLKTDENYQIIIDLSAFDNSVRNVETKVNGNILSIEGAGIKNTRNGEKLVKFEQSYMFGNNVKLNEMTRKHEGDFYIITLPIED